MTKVSLFPQKAWVCAQYHPYERVMVRSYERLEQLKEYWMSSVTLNAGSIPATFSNLKQKQYGKYELLQV
jgi:hypothetical protein